MSSSINMEKGKKRKNFLQKVGGWLLNDEIKHLDTLNFNMNGLRIVGGFLPHKKIQGCKRPIFFVYCVLVTFFFNIAIVMMESIDAYQVLMAKDLDKIAQNLCLTMNLMNIMYKVINAGFCRDDIIWMYRMCKQFTVQFADETDKQQKRIIIRNERLIRFVTRSFLYMCTLCNCMSMFNQLIDAEEANENFPLRAYHLPFLPDKFFNPVHGMIIYWNALLVVTHDSTLMVLMSEIITQVMLLKFNLRKLGSINDVKVMNRKLAKCVAHHQSICKFMRTFERTYSYVFLMQFFTSMCLFGLVGFQATVTPGYSRAQFTINVYCVCLLIELFSMCSLAHEIIEQGKSIANTIYFCSWYDCGTKFGQNLQLFIAYAQKPMTISAGGYFVVSLETFTKVLTRSYSYVTLLRQVYYENGV